MGSGSLVGRLVCRLVGRSVLNSCEVFSLVSLVDSCLLFRTTMSGLAARLVSEAEKRDLDADLALKALQYFAKKSQERGKIETPDVIDPGYPIHNQASLCW